MCVYYKDDSIEAASWMKVLPAVLPYKISMKHYPYFQLDIKMSYDLSSKNLRRHASIPLVPPATHFLFRLLIFSTISGFFGLLVLRDLLVASISGTTPSAPGFLHLPALTLLRGFVMFRGNGNLPCLLGILLFCRLFRFGASPLTLSPSCSDAPGSHRRVMPGCPGLVLFGSDAFDRCWRGPWRYFKEAF